MEKKEDLRSYREIWVQEHVLVNVPRESHDMRFMPAHQFELHGKPVEVSERWQNGMAIGNTILNRHFYEVSQEDLGRRVVATVEVLEKTTRDGRKFTMLNIRKEANGTRPTHQLKITDESGGVSISGATKFVHFQQL